MVVKKSELASDSLLHTFFSDGDFLDCFSVRIDRADAPIGEIAQRLFIGMPRWINMLLAVRDFGTTPFGLKSTANLPKNLTIRPSINVGDHINFLCVRGIGKNEVILGEDDLHLDFKISVYRDVEIPGRISLATWVRTHNRLGKIYLGTIAPFHALIVNSRLTDLVRHYAH